MRDAVEKIQNKKMENDVSGRDVGKLNRNSGCRAQIKQEGEMRYDRYGGIRGTAEIQDSGENGGVGTGQRGNIRVRQDILITH